jgi:hypothetical protein
MTLNISGNGSIVGLSPAGVGISSADVVGYNPAGTGAVATTVQGKLRESVSVEDFGAVGDGVTDDTVAIQAAVDSFGTTGGILLVPTGVYRISNTIKISHGGIVVQGEGSIKDPYSRVSAINLNFADAIGTVFEWYGTAGAVMVQFGYESGITTRKVSGGALKGFALNGRGSAGTALKVISTDRCDFDDLVLQKTTSYGLHTTTAGEVMPFLGANDTQDNVFSNIMVSVGGTAIGVFLDSEFIPSGISSNTSINTFTAITVRYANGDAFVFGDSDSNTVTHLRCLRLVGDTGKALRFKGAVAGVSWYARSNFVYHFASSQGGVVAEEGDLSHPSVDNAVYGQNLDGGAVSIIVTIDAAARLTWVNPRFSTQTMRNVISFLDPGSYASANTTATVAKTVFDSFGYSASNLFSNSGEMLAMHHGSSGETWGVIVNATGMILRNVASANDSFSVQNPIDTSQYYTVDSVQVVSNRATGWGVPTGTRNRSAFDVATATTTQLAARLAGLIDDMTAHGLIGS